MKKQFKKLRIALCAVGFLSAMTFVKGVAFAQDEDSDTATVESSQPSSDQSGSSDTDTTDSVPVDESAE